MIVALPLTIVSVTRTIVPGARPLTFKVAPAVLTCSVLALSERHLCHCAFTRWRTAETCVEAKLSVRPSRKRRTRPPAFERTTRP